MKIQTILDQIDMGSMALPEFQRGYVWNRDQVRSLMHSLYYRYPVGSLMVWATKTENADTRGDATLAAGVVKLLLDGQQRITSLYGIIKGHPPLFFEGNADAFTGLYFHLEDEAFEFYGPLKMKDNPLWIDVTALMQGGVGNFFTRLTAIPNLKLGLNEYINRLSNLENIRNIELHVEEVSGDDKTVDVVVDIFNRVNSGGTKLSKGDLALARICAAWPDARQEMNARLTRWHHAGFHFRLEWLLRNINTIMTGEALFIALKDIDTPTFKKGLSQAERGVDTILNMIAGRLGLDHEQVLGSRYSFPLIARYLAERNWQLDYKEWDKILYWYVHTFLWGRYASSTESVLNQDLAAIEQRDGALDRLIELLRQNRGDLNIMPKDFAGWSQGARFYPLLYMLTRVYHAKDWNTGLELSAHLLGRHNRLNLHHIFPKAMLYKHGYSRAEVNALANFTFLTQDTNLLISDRDPAEYLPQFAAKQPGAIESHWLPIDPRLWQVQNYREFLEARRALLAEAANGFLNGLVTGAAPKLDKIESIVDRDVASIPGGIGSDEEESELWECNEWVIQQGLPEGELRYELADPQTGQPLAILDLAWPNGLQEGLSDPVALLLDESQDVEQIVNEAGYRYFTDRGAFLAYVQRDILALPEQVA